MQATYASTQADFEFGRQSLAATMAKSWFTASETWLQLQIAEDMVEAAQELVTLAETRWQVGAGNEQDVALARANLGNFQDTAKQVRLAHTQSLRAAGTAARSLSGRRTSGPPRPARPARPDPRRPAAGDAGAPPRHGRRRAPRRRRLQSRRRSQGRALAAHHPERQCRGDRERHPGIEGGFRESDGRRGRKLARADLPGRRADRRRSKSARWSRRKRSLNTPTWHCAPSAMWRTRSPPPKRWQNAIRSCSKPSLTTSAPLHWRKRVIASARSICVPCSNSCWTCTVRAWPCCACRANNWPSARICTWRWVEVLRSRQNLPMSRLARTRHLQRLPVSCNSRSGGRLPSNFSSWYFYPPSAMVPDTTMQPITTMPIPTRHGWRPVIRPKV